MKKNYLLYYPGNEKGVAAVEFSLIAPVLILILLGLLDAGLYINTQMKLENTARAAAEYVYLSGDINNIPQDIVSFADFGKDQGSLTMNTEYHCECTGGTSTWCTQGCGGGYMRKFVEVNLELDYNTLFNYPGLPSPVHLQGYVRYQVQ